MEYMSPIGTLLISADENFITQIRFKTQNENCTNKSNALAKQCAQELDAYFSGELRDFTVPFRADGTPFRMKVWKELQNILYGETISYKELAKRIGNPAAIRAVGGANHHNPINIIIPCHRVIGANGDLTGYGGGVEQKKFLLELERRAIS
ncbi:MAG: methylated-DNA--[protein]-cysteine S-methyltransferase [Clostridiales bacterium]|jgi:methylated-DNA-[protein]-cysteine S-methyltransferase|nr:methylated-DNA--[protein]-cysteine S-methyltransferase [Clostridiales bacterium]